MFMRNLTVKRQKSVVACIVRMKVYIEDINSNDIVVDGKTYRKLGDVGNGEEMTFSIDENEHNIIVIADTLSKGFCNDLCKIPAGQNNVFVSGKNVFNPAAGNAFRFDGTTDINIIKNRKNGSLKGALVLIASLAFGAVLGYILVSLMY